MSGVTVAREAKSGPKVKTVSVRWRDHSPVGESVAAALVRREGMSRVPLALPAASPMLSTQPPQHRVQNILAHLGFEGVNGSSKVAVIGNGRWRDSILFRQFLTDRWTIFVLRFLVTMPSALGGRVLHV